MITAARRSLALSLFVVLGVWVLSAQAQEREQEQGREQEQEQEQERGQGSASAGSGAAPRLMRVEEGAAAIRLDGFLDEAVWETVPARDGMRVVSPDTLAEARYETHIRTFYTERGIYVGVMNHQPPGTHLARMTSRDTRLVRDGFTVGIDPSGEGLYGFFLRINLGDSLTDGTILPERQLNMQWDGSWNARTQALENGWSVEFFVPWSMMPLPSVADDIRQVGFYFERQVGRLGGETWAVPALPRTVNEYLSAFHRYELRDIEPRTQLTYYPFAAAGFDGVGDSSESKIGTELFWRPTTNTQLSATLNPDFGNVEADNVVVNLGAFETFFPEKRSFFLEGQDLFITSPRASGGGPGGPIQLLNTRRIGRPPNFDIPDGVETEDADVNRPTELLGALKFVGQSGNWRYGTLLAVENDTEITGILPAMEDDTDVTGTDGLNRQVAIGAEGRDFAVARLLYEGTGTGDRRSIGWMGTNVMYDDSKARVNAVDIHYFSADNRWLTDTQLMHSRVDDVGGAGLLADVRFRPRRGVNHNLRATWVDDNFALNDLGFITRNDQMNLDYSYGRTESDVPGLRERETRIFFTNQWNTDGRPVRIGFFYNREYTYHSNNRFFFSLRYFPARIDDRLGGQDDDDRYRRFRTADRVGFNISYSTARSKPLSYGFELQSDPDNTGEDRYRSGAGMSWRPNDRFSLDFEAEYTDQDALLRHHGRGMFTGYESHRWSSSLETNYFITAKQQLRFTMQWTGLKAFEDRHWRENEEELSKLLPADPHEDSADFSISRLTFQARYRWEIAPLSDLFVVYTRGGNASDDDFAPFPKLFERAWNAPVVDAVAVKLRYRLGS